VTRESADARDPDSGADAARDRDPGAGEGWVKQFVVMPDRAREAADLFRSLGHEVRIEAATAEDLPDGCDDCALALGLFKTVYTRRPA
jgi:hypothetical protein